MFGDWLDTAAPPDNPAAARTPWQCVATAYLARSARIIARAAGVLGRDGSEFADLADRAAERFRAEYVDAERPAHLSVTDGLRAGARARPAAARAAAARRRTAGRAGGDDGCHIAAGFLGTPFVTDALTNAGELATAYELLLQRENPSWLYPVTMGATTIWERWDSMLPDGSINPGDMTSFNHYAFGAVADWLHRTVGGSRAGRSRATGGSGSPRAPARASPRPRPRTRPLTARRTCPGHWTAPLHAGRHRAGKYHRRGVAAGRQRDVRGRLGAAFVRRQHSRTASGREARTVLGATGMMVRSKEEGRLQSDEGARQH